MLDDVGVKMQIIMNKKELVNTFIALAMCQVGTAPFSFYVLTQFNFSTALGGCHYYPHYYREEKTETKACSDLPKVSHSKARNGAHADWIICGHSAQHPAHSRSSN